jgi:hypothetical protein
VLIQPEPSEKQNGDNATMHQQSANKRRRYRVPLIEYVDLFSHLASLTRRLINGRGHHFDLKLGFAQLGDNLRDRVPWCLFIGTHIDGGGIVKTLSNSIGKQVNIDRLVIQKRFAIPRDADHRQILCRVLHAPDLRYLNVEPELHDIRGNHKNHEQDKDHIDQRNNVNFGHGRWSAEPSSTPPAAAAVE